MFQHKITELENIKITCPICKDVKGSIIITSLGDIHATPDLLPIFKCIIEQKEFIVLCKKCNMFFGVLISSNKEISQVKK